MKTPSHMLMGIAVAALVPGKRFRKVSFVIGCGAPDVFIICLFCCVAGWALIDTSSTTANIVSQFSKLYFESPLCAAAHNVLHSPVSLAALAILFWIFLSALARERAMSFILGAAFHSIVDVLVHHDDGPLLLWPLDWTLRFQSPVSHWDPAHFGGLVLAIEVAAFAFAFGALLLRLCNPWRVLGWIARFSEP